MRMRTSSVAATFFFSLDFILWIQKLCLQLCCSRMKGKSLLWRRGFLLSRKQTVALLAELLRQNLVGKTQIQTIVKEKEDIMKRWVEGERTDVK